MHADRVNPAQRLFRTRHGFRFHSLLEVCQRALPHDQRGRAAVSFWRKRKKDGKKLRKGAGRRAAELRPIRIFAEIRSCALGYVYEEHPLVCFRERKGQNDCV